MQTTGNVSKYFLFRKLHGKFYLQESLGFDKETCQFLCTDIIIICIVGVSLPLKISHREYMPTGNFPSSFAIISYDISCVNNEVS